ncbi:MAG: acetyl-CoA C-acyltransferase [Candidatus Sericytochromatia bacterium]|nr:acetyl-CoA C-acyltransferase [Candidatus Sericytochromatia bacterium]
MTDSIVLLGGARTPFLEFGGPGRDLSPTELGVVAAQGALERAGVSATDIEDVVMGNVVHCREDAAYLARHVALHAGIPIEAPALTVNRLCGSGLQAVVTAAQDILLGEAEVALAGGTESLSTAPYVIPKARWGHPMNAMPLVDTLWSALTDKFCKTPMAITAENLAEKHGISRQEQDAFSLRSHALAAAAKEALACEIVSVRIQGKKGDALLEQDEHVRAEATLEALARLPARFREGGTVTAGNASGINDGAAAVVLARSSWADRKGLKPLGILRSWAVAGVEPSIMGIGPVPASRKALERSGLRLQDMAVVEINEAFAAQALAVCRELSLDPERINLQGGAIALGHPLAASGTRLVLTALEQLRQRGGGHALVTLCIGGGQGIAAVLEVNDT